MKTLKHRGALLLFFSAFAGGAQSEALIKRSVPVEGFRHIVLATAGDLHVTQTEGTSLVIEAEAQVLERLRARVIGGVLYLETNGKPIVTDQPIRFLVTAPRLDHVEGQSAGRITLDALNAPRFALEISGSHEVNAIDLQTQTLEVNLQGSGKVALAGSAQRQTITIAGSAAYVSPRLDSEEATVNISGSGDALVKVTQRLQAAVSGSGEVRFLGDPTVQSEVSGSGTVKPAAQ